MTDSIKNVFIILLYPENLRMVLHMLCLLVKTDILFKQIRGLKHKISLGNRAYRIQHTQNMIKSLVPNFY